MRWSALSFLLLCALPGAGTALAAEGAHVTLASTTSTQSSGLFDYLLPRFAAARGIEVRVVAVGTGQAIRLAERGDADVLLVHHRASEEAFVAAGHGLDRREVMYNDFVLVGPRADPAAASGGDDVVAALQRIASAGAVFVSRGDDSGTHKAELTLWGEAGVDVAAASGGWYRETGSGMGATLNTAAAMGAYTLVDRATWLAFANRADLAVLVEGDARLFNVYGVTLVNPARHPHVRAAEARALADWLVGEEGQRAIAEYRIGGQPVFFPSAAASE